MPTLSDTDYARRIQELRNLPFASLLSVVPEHSNLIYIYGRYTLDEYIFRALYDQDTKLFESMEPLQSSRPQFLLPPVFQYQITSSKSGELGAFNYDS